MEDNNKTYGVIIGAIVLIAVLFYFMSSSAGKPVDWRKTYKASSKEPYGTYLLDKLLKNDEHFNYDGKKITKSQFDSLKNLGNDLSLFFLGHQFSITEERADSLVAFVQNGGTVFIAAEEFDEDFIQYISTNWYTSAYYGDSVSVTVPNAYESYNYVHVSDFDTIDYSWKTINENQIYYEYDHESLSNLEGAPNVVSISFGDYSGKLILCSTPLLFTNYYLRNESHLRYAERIFSEIPEGEMIWSPLHWTSKKDGPNWSSDKRESPLQFIISNKYYRAAYITILAFFLLIMIFKSKRKQNIIPAVERKDNNSVIFVQNLAELYFIQGENRKLVNHQKKIFINYVWEHYRVSLQEADDKKINRLAAISQKDKSLIEEILNKFRLHKDGHDFSNKMLIELDQELDKFYSA